jgi:hypothetical protein
MEELTYSRNLDHDSLSLIFFPGGGLKKFSDLALSRDNGVRLGVSLVVEEGVAGQLGCCLGLKGARALGEVDMSPPAPPLISLTLPEEALACILLVDRADRG